MWCKSGARATNRIFRRWIRMRVRLDCTCKPGVPLNRPPIPWPAKRCCLTPAEWLSGCRHGCGLNCRRSQWWKRLQKLCYKSNSGSGIFHVGLSSVVYPRLDERQILCPPSPHASALVQFPTLSSIRLVRYITAKSRQFCLRQMLKSIGYILHFKSNDLEHEANSNRRCRIQRCSSSLEFVTKGDRPSSHNLVQ